MKKLTLLLTVLLLGAATSLFARTEVERWGCFELRLNHAAKANPFDVALSATFTNGDRKIVVRGFYDGDDTYLVRFMPPVEGEWRYTTRSSAAALNRRSGSFVAVPPAAGNHGPGEVDGDHGFRYANGSRYMPFGTTNYALALFRPETQEATIRSLAASGFNKTRLCVLPKDYPTPLEAPTIFPFELRSRTVDAEGKEHFDWDFERFNPAFFRNLDHRIRQLQELGIEADLILFHPYDRGMWGFDKMPEEINRRYLDYLIARVGAYRNVWWSMANEWDLVRNRTVEEWKDLTRHVAATDPYGHLCSIHGGTAVYFDYGMPEFTHVSIQDEAPVFTASAAATLRQIFPKPVICDEIGYEGNLPLRWARYSPQLMTYYVTNGLMGGIYVTHGECYRDPSEEDFVYWSDGSILRGGSWQRIAFLRRILEEGPNPPRMADVSRDTKTSTAGDGYYYVWLGQSIQSSWRFNLPASNARYRRPQEGERYRVDIIDVWAMTVTEVPGVFETTKPIDYRLYDKHHRDVRLPDVPYLLLRIRRVAE